MSAASTRYGCRIVLAIALLIAASQSVSAQTTQARVRRDQSIVWNLSMPTPITTMSAGTVLEVVGRVREFYIVRHAGGRRTACRVRTDRDLTSRDHPGCRADRTAAAGDAAKRSLW